MGKASEGWIPHPLPQAMGFARQFVQGLEFRLQAAFGGMFAFRNAPPEGGTPNGTRLALDHRDELVGKAQAMRERECFQSRRSGSDGGFGGRRLRVVTWSEYRCGEHDHHCHSEGGFENEAEQASAESSPAGLQCLTGAAALPFHGQRTARKSAGQGAE